MVKERRIKGEKEEQINLPVTVVALMPARWGEPMASRTPGLGGSLGEAKEKKVHLVLGYSPPFLAKARDASNPEAGEVAKHSQQRDSHKKLGTASGWSAIWVSPGRLKKGGMIRTTTSLSNKSSISTANRLTSHLLPPPHSTPITIRLEFPQRLLRCLLLLLLGTPSRTTNASTPILLLFMTAGTPVQTDHWSPHTTRHCFGLSVVELGGIGDCGGFVGGFSGESRQRAWQQGWLGRRP